jgi:hypothetical protein
MAIRCAFLTKVRFEDIKKCGFSSVWVASFLAGKATGNLSPNKANPMLSDKADSCHAAMIMLVGVGEADNSIGLHGVTSKSWT